MNLNCGVPGCVNYEPGHEVHYDGDGETINPPEAEWTGKVEVPREGIRLPTGYDPAAPIPTTIIKPDVEPDEARRRWAIEQAITAFHQPHVFPVKENILKLADDLVNYVKTGEWMPV